MADRTVFGWRRVARILASERDAELLAAMGIPQPTGATRDWARELLDDVEDFWEAYDVEPDGGEAARQRLGHLARMLDREDRAALDAWANAEVDAWQGEPRPAIWPPRKPLAIEPVR